MLYGVIGMKAIWSQVVVVILLLIGTLGKRTLYVCSLSVTSGYLNHLEHALGI